MVKIVIKSRFISLLKHVDTSSNIFSPKYVNSQISINEIIYELLAAVDLSCEFICASLFIKEKSLVLPTFEIVGLNDKSPTILNICSFSLKNQQFRRDIVIILHADMVLISPYEQFMLYSFNVAPVG